MDTPKCPFMDPSPRFPVGKAGENPKPERVFSERSEETLSCPPQALKFLR